MFRLEVKMLKEFKEFALRGNVMDLAIGVIIGAAFGKIVSSLVTDILMPPIGLLLGKVDFSNLYISLTGEKFKSLADAQAAGAATLNYGIFLNNIINFIIVALVIFIIIRQINRLTKKPAPAAEPTTRECPYCITQVSVKATRCPNCTSDLKPANK
jgi:large conductance mechanosensitive channel